MHVFIDTNIFLSFYDFSSEDLTELDKLLQLIKAQELTLHVPQQVIDETWRNRDAKINTSLSTFKKWTSPLSFPAYCKTYPGYEDLKQGIENCEKQHKVLLEEVKNHIKKRELQADILIKKLFKAVAPIERTPAILAKAQERVAIGHPPGKPKEFGDAIHWESLLSAVPEKEDLHLISRDEDFFSPLDKNQPHPFLMDEWTAKKKGTVATYKTLSDLFKDNKKENNKNNKININLQSEDQSDEESFLEDSLIGGLAESPCYKDTHILIAALSTYHPFSDGHMESLLHTFFHNTQVYDICTDCDVRAFYRPLCTPPFTADERLAGIQKAVQDILSESDGKRQSELIESSRSAFFT